MRSKVFFLSAFLIFNILNTVGQTEISEKEAISLKENIIEKSKNTTSISNDFVQSKHLSFLSKDIISKGKLIFKAPNLIKWQYVIPFKYSVVFKGDKLLINDNGTKSDVDLSSSKTFKELNALIVKSVKGDMFDEEKFKISYYKKGEDYLIVFKTIDDSIKSFINVFELTFDAKMFNVLEVRMVESTEDYTSIKFLNQKINERINDEIFIN